MRKFVAAAFLIAIGFGAGWQARDFSVNHEQARPQALSSIRDAATVRDRQLGNLSNEARQPAPQNNASLTPLAGSSAVEMAASEKAAVNPDHRAATDSLNATIARFNTYLDKRQHSQALNLYREVEFRNTEAAAELKAILVARLRVYLADGRQEDFTDLINTYLASYYNDTEILLLLAEFNARADYLSEALATYQLILSYAQGKADRHDAATRLNDFISAADKQHAEAGMWYELQVFYELVEQYGLGGARHQFRLAEIYLLNGYDELGKNIFQNLLSHPQWGKQAGMRLEALAENRVPEVSVPAYVEQVPLQPIGEHYLVKANIADADQVHLIIDTGASTTLVSSERFAQLSGHDDFVRLPSRMFNTVNGITRGNVYLVPQFTLGTYRLSDVEVAVVDFQPGGNIDGLLGMNVLRNFRFEIDQDAATLLLERRGQAN